MMPWKLRHRIETVFLNTRNGGCMRHHCNTETLLRGRETQQARHSDGTGLLGPGFLNTTNCDVLGVQNGTKHVESRHGLIHLEAKVVAHSKW